MTFLCVILERSEGILGLRTGSSSLSTKFLFILQIHCPLPEILSLISFVRGRQSQGVTRFFYFCFKKNCLTKLVIFANLDLSKVKGLARGVVTSLLASMQDVKFCKPDGYLYVMIGGRQNKPFYKDII